MEFKYQVGQRWPQSHNRRFVAASLAILTMVLSAPTPTSGSPPHNNADQVLSESASSWADVLQVVDEKFNPEVVVQEPLAAGQGLLSESHRVHNKVPETALKEGGKDGESGVKAEGGHGKQEGGKKGDDGSTVPRTNLWAIFSIVVMLIMGTVVFETCKNQLMHTVHGTPMMPLVVNLFSELTVLGFLGVVTFLIGQYTLHYLSMLIFGEHGKAQDEENKELLGKMLEHIHMVIFFIMVIFIAEAVGMIVLMRMRQQKWTEIESSVLLPSGRIAAVQELQEAQAISYWPGEVAFSLTDRACKYTAALKRVRFMLLRTDFIHHVEDSKHKKEDDPEAQLDLKSDVTQLRNQFGFYLYLSKVMGERLAYVVDIPVRQWLALLIMIWIFMACSSVAGGSWSFMLFLWLAIGWGMLLMTHLFLMMIKTQLMELTHENDGMALLETHSKTTLDGKWIATTPLYMKKLEEKPVHLMPTFLVGEPGNPKYPGQQKMFNIMLFGRNEVTFQLIVLRFLFLSMAMYTAIFCYQVIPSHLLVVYLWWEAAILSVFGLLPVMLIYFCYLSEVVESSVMLTSTGCMRVRSSADEVVRHQKESNAVSLMRLIAIIIDGDHEPLAQAEVDAMQDALDQDAAETLNYPEDLRRSGGRSANLAAYVGEYLNDKAAEIVMARMICIFESFDTDGSGALSKAEIYGIFKEIGFDSPDAIDKCLEPMLKGVNQGSRYMAVAAIKAKPKPGLFGCASGKEAPDAMSLELKKGAPVSGTVMTKPVFLSWFLHLEKRARLQSADQVADMWFSKIDDDHSGFLSVVELQEVLEACGTGFTANDMTALVLQLDTNGDGQFDHDEFTAWIESHEPQLR